MKRILRRVAFALLVASMLAALTAMVSSACDGRDSFFIAKTSEFG